MSSATASAPAPTASSPEATLARYGRSFSWASHLLAPPTRSRAAWLYAVCRTIDDLADEAGEEGQQHLQRLLHDLEAGKAPPEMRELAPPGTPARRALLQLVSTAASDRDGRRTATAVQLIRYAHGVAGTVGVLMCHVLLVRDPRALPFAIDLGIGMQLTNIARDVLEDARHDRSYLPADLLDEPASPAELVAGHASARRAAYAGALRLLDLAERYYASADRGMRFLPWRARLAIFTAARVYRGIGGVIRRLGHERYWTQRAVVGRAEKLWLTLRAFGAFLRPRSWPLGAAPQHDPALHAPLVTAGLLE